VSTLVFKTEPRPYQIPALKKVIRHKGGGLYVPMRWGKSWVAINWAAALHLKYSVEKVLIICPNDVKDVWLEEIEKHCPVEYRITTADDYAVQGILTFVIRNYESVWARQRDDELGRGWTAISDPDLTSRYRAQAVILDEAHHVGKPTTLTSKKVCQVARLAYFRLFLTGTPFHRKPFYVFGQFKYYDPSIFGEQFGAFKRHVAVFGGYNNYEVKRYQNLKWLRKKIKPHVFIQEYVPTTPPVYRSYKFALTGMGLGHYRAMERESITTVGDHEITAPIALTRYLRLAQIAGGWLKTEEGKYVRVGSDKRDLLARRVFEYEEQGILKVVVGCRFLPEIVDAARVFREAGYEVYLVHGGVARQDRVVRRKAFTAADKAVFITQFRPSREGIDLSTADLMVFYSLPEDYLTYDQFSRRIEKYDEKRTLLYEHLIGRGTVEELAYKALSRQEDIARYIMKDPKLVEALTAEA